LFPFYNCFTWILKQISLFTGIRRKLYHMRQILGNFHRLFWTSKYKYFYQKAELSAYTMRAKERQFLAVNSSSSASQTLITRLRAWRADVVIPITSKANCKNIEKEEFCLSFSVLSLSLLCFHHTKVTPAALLATAYLSLLLGALWGRNHLPLVQIEHRALSSSGLCVSTAGPWSLLQANVVTKNGKIKHVKNIKPKK